MSQRSHDERGVTLRLPKQWIEGAVKRMRVFLWMWRFEFYVRDTVLTQRSKVRGWWLDFWTPMFIIQIRWKAEDWTLMDGLVTSVNLGCFPKNWWGIGEGGIATKFRREKVFRRWRIVDGAYETMIDGTFYCRRHLEEIPLSPDLHHPKANSI
jgi:hypothetical protein